MAKAKEYYLGMYEKSMPSDLSWEQKLTYCKDAGFDWLEISIDESDAKLARLDWSNEEIKAVKDAMDKTGVRIKTMCLSGHRRYPLGSNDPKVVETSLDIMQKAIDLAYELGISIIQLAGYDVYYEKSSNQTAERFYENLRKSVLMAARKGVLLGFETMETQFMDTVEKAMKYVKLVNSPYLNVYPDLGNLTNAEKIYGVKVVDDLKLGNGKIVAAHLKETVPGKYREIPFGSGHTEYVEDIKVLKDMGVRMFTGEFWYVGQEDWFDVCKDAASFLRDKLNKAFEIYE